MQILLSDVTFDTKIAEIKSTLSKFNIKYFSPYMVFLIYYTHQNNFGLSSNAWYFYLLPLQIPPFP